VLGPTAPSYAQEKPCRSHARDLRRDAGQGEAAPLRLSPINVTSSQTLAALRGFAEAGSDGIVQVSTGGAEYLSGSTVKDMVLGATALAEYAHHVAKADSRSVSGAGFSH